MLDKWKKRIDESYELSKQQERYDNLYRTIRFDEISDLMLSKLLCLFEDHGLIGYDFAIFPNEYLLLTGNYGEEDSYLPGKFSDLKNRNMVDDVNIMEGVKKTYIFRRDLVTYLRTKKIQKIKDKI